MMLLDTPPGQHPTKRMPKANGASRCHTCTNSHATAGMMKNCAQVPINTSNGRCARMRKSSVVSVRPMVSMMMPRMTVWVVPRTQSKRCGKKKVTSATPMTNTEAWAANRRLTACMCFIVFMSFFVVETVCKSTPFLANKQTKSSFLVQQAFLEDRKSMDCGTHRQLCKTCRTGCSWKQSLRNTEMNKSRHSGTSFPPHRPMLLIYNKV